MEDILKHYGMSHGYYVKYVNGKPMYLHRYIMQEHLKRNLNSNEIVHHKNHIKTDNRIKNLKVLTKFQHNMIHHPKKVRGNCKAKGCNKTEYRGIYCNAHYLRSRIYGNPNEPLKRFRNPKSCKVIGCIKKPVAKFLCPMHYQRIRLGIL